MGDYCEASMLLLEPVQKKLDVICTQYTTHTEEVGHAVSTAKTTYMKSVF